MIWSVYYTWAKLGGNGIFLAIENDENKPFIVYLYAVKSVNLEKKFTKGVVLQGFTLSFPIVKKERRINFRGSTAL